MGGRQIWLAETCCEHVSVPSRLEDLDVETIASSVWIQVKELPQPLSLSGRCLSLPLRGTRAGLKTFGAPRKGWRFSFCFVPLTSAQNGLPQRRQTFRLPALLGSILTPANLFRGLLVFNQARPQGCVTRVRKGDGSTTTTSRTAGLSGQENLVSLELQVFGINIMLVKG